MNVSFLLAAGQSKRFGSDKLFATLRGKPVIWHSLKFLHDTGLVGAIFIAVNSANKKKIEKLVRDENFSKVKKIVLGGKTRWVSVQKLLRVLRDTPKFLIIHNAANPLATEDELCRCISYIKGSVAGAAVGRQVSATIKNAPAGCVKYTLPREDLWEMETPQVVRGREFVKALKFAPKAHYTDDLSVFEAAGMKTAVTTAALQNRKITTEEDLKLARIFCGDAGAIVSVGIGEDSHRWKNSNFEFRNSKKMPLILGGIKIPKLPALEAESDGDVILHALCNAIAGALGEGSLGTYATRMAKKGIQDSKKYLQVIQNKMKRQHMGIYQCSISIEASRPKIDPLAPRIKKNLSQLLQIPIERIGITATSGEKLTPFGRGEAMRCQAIVLLQ